MTAQPLEYPSQAQVPSLLEPLSPEQIQKIIDLLDEWMADESGYDEETWPELKAALDRERDEIGAQRLFDEYGWRCGLRLSHSLI